MGYPTKAPGITSMERPPSRRRKRTVRFSEEPVRVGYTFHIDDIHPDDYWYSNDQHDDLQDRNCDLADKARKESRKHIDTLVDTYKRVMQLSRTALHEDQGPPVEELLDQSKNIDKWVSRCSLYRGLERWVSNSHKLKRMKERQQSHELVFYMSRLGASARDIAAAYGDFCAGSRTYALLFGYADAYLVDFCRTQDEMKKSPVSPSAGRRKSLRSSRALETSSPGRGKYDKILASADFPSTTYSRRPKEESLPVKVSRGRRQSIRTVRDCH